MFLLPGENLTGGGAGRGRRGRRAGARLHSVGGGHGAIAAALEFTVEVG